MNDRVAVVIACLALANSVSADTPAVVTKQGQHSVVKLEHVVTGHLKELNGKYKLRLTEVIYDPSGLIGEHHHVGPGIRCVTSGELTYVQAAKVSVYRRGDCFFESGDVTHTATNGTAQPVVLLNFEVLPSDWAESSAIPAPN